jgi:hypothetical protein
VGLVVALRKHRSVRGMQLGAMADDALGVALLAVPSAEESSNPTTAAASPLQRSYPDGGTVPLNPLQRLTNPPAGGGQVLDADWVLPFV